VEIPSRKVGQPPGSESLEVWRKGFRVRLAILHGADIAENREGFVKATFSLSYKFLPMIYGFCII